MYVNQMYCLGRESSDVFTVRRDFRGRQTPEEFYLATAYMSTQGEALTVITKRELVRVRKVLR